MTVVRLAQGKLEAAGGWDNGAVLVQAGQVRTVIESAQRLADEIEYLREGLEDIRSALPTSDAASQISEMVRAKCDERLKDE